MPANRSQTAVKQALPTMPKPHFTGDIPQSEIQRMIEQYGKKR